MKKGILFKIEDGKLLTSRREPLESIDKGACYYCGQPVYVGEGQIIKYKVIRSGDTVTEYPTHKKCRRKLGVVKK